MQLNWTPGSKSVGLECRGQEIESCHKVLSSFLDEFRTNEVTVEEAFWDTVLTEMPRILSSFKENPPLIKVLQDEKKLRIVSSKSDIEQHISCLRREMEKVKTEAGFHEKTISTAKCPKGYIHFLKEINFVENHLRRQCNCNDVHVIFDEEDHEIQIKGPVSQVDIAVREFEEQELATKEASLKLPQQILECLFTDEGRQAMKRKLDEHNLKAIVVFDDPSSAKDLHAKVIAFASVYEAIDCIRDVATEKEVRFDESNIRLKRTPEWLTLCDEVRAEFAVLIRESDSGTPNILITGLTENAKNAAERLQTYLDINSIENGEYVCPSSDIRDYITQYRKEELCEIQTKLNEFDVQFVGNDEDQTFYISGRRKGLEQAKSYLDDLIKNIVVFTGKARHPGFRRYFEENGKGDRWVKTIQNAHKCLIRVEDDLYRRKESDYFVTAEGHVISWKIGDIAKEQVGIHLFV